MNRALRLLSSLAVATALAFAVTFAVVRAQPDAPRGELASGPGGSGTAVLALAPSPRTSGTEEADSYDLSRLPVLSAVINLVDRSYVDPKRIDPKAMVVAALDGVERAAAEVMAEGDAASGHLTLTVGTARRDVDISGVRTIFDVRLVLGGVMGFVQKNLTTQKSAREIEYAAVNGMLSTLDPHTVLYDPRGFRDLRTATRGEFGGLGFVISMRDGNLTVMRVLKNTPAQRAGIKARDVITRIEDQSTINMDVQDAVDRLRGKPATKVNIVVSRAAWPEARKLAVTREIINLETVPQAKLLDKGIGYVRISQFAANTTRDLVGSIQQQRAQAGGSLRGLVLDLRNNPGGLLDQAIQVSDLFLSEGVIVKTVGGDRVETKEAHGDREDLASLPLVVLVNNSSASASEIVAGALKNNNRALVIGRQTFGKGSVQVLHDFPAPGKPGEDLALKLTIAQYLTPGDVSIQEVGITPDVLLLPGRALKDAINYFAPPRSLGEVDLDRHLSNPTESALPPAETARRAAERAARTEKAPLELRYLLDEKEDAVAKALKADEKREAAARAHGEAEVSPEQLEDEEVEANPDEVVEDFQIRFARELLARHPYADRPRLLEAARLLVAERAAEEEGRLEQRLGQLGIDWAGGPATGTPRPLVTVSPPPGKRVGAGETVPWTVTVENRGDAPLRRLRAWTTVQKSPWLDRREFVFGLVKPGEKRSWTVPVKLPRGMDSRHEEVKLHFEDDGGRAPPDASVSLDVTETGKPQFAFSTQVDDDQGGNGDGLVERGEDFSLRVDVRNDGAGPSGEKTFVSLKSLGDDKVFIKKGRVVVGALKPGESKQAVLQVEVRKGLKPDVVPLQLSVYDEKSDEYQVAKLDLPVRAEGLARTAARGLARVTAAESFVRAGASADAPVLGVARKGALLPVEARYGDLLRVEWKKGRHGYVAAAETAAATGKAAGQVAEVWQRDPPRITLSPDPARGAPVVDGERLRVEGVAQAAPGPGPRRRLRDVFIFVNDQKVFFKAAPDAETGRLEFSADVPLKPGNNVVTVFAREDEEFQSHRSFAAYRRVAEVAAQGTAKQGEK
ncbi:MAG: PDZ domain-containing protein [Deltaproteobacteria bacterium]|nr:PDZ domain-containing protein [Deltaproteobacteria bacterium]